MPGTRDTVVNKTKSPVLMELGKKWETDNIAGNMYASGEEFHKGNSGVVKRQVVARGRVVLVHVGKVRAYFLETRRGERGSLVNTRRRPACTGSRRCELGQNSACLQKSTEANMARAE